MALSGKGRRVQDDKWIDDLSNCKTFFVAKGRMPNQRDDDVAERRLGKWIVRNKVSERGNNSERKQLMRRETPPAFEDNSSRVQVDKWMNNLANCKKFFVAKGRMPNKKADDVDERRLGKWNNNNKSRKEEPTANANS
jgi:hypothetical protein